MRSRSGKSKKNICYTEVSLSQFLLCQSVNKVLELLTTDIQLFNHDFQRLKNLPKSYFFNKFGHTELPTYSTKRFYYICLWTSRHRPICWKWTRARDSDWSQKNSKETKAEAKKRLKTAESMDIEWTHSDLTNK